MNRKGLVILALLAIIIFLLLTRRPMVSSSAAVTGYGGQAVGAPAATGMSTFDPGAVSSASLIPRDVATSEDFGQFSPDKILSAQSYLDPRSQLGYPETLGGVLRNANQSERSEPPNPRTPVSIFNLSTIPPDVMRPRFDIDFDYK